MSRSRMPLLLMLGCRDAVHGLFGVVGRLGMIALLVGVVMVLDGGGFVYFVVGAVGFAAWYGSRALRWGYDSSVLRRVPEGESLHLF